MDRSNRISPRSRLLLAALCLVLCAGAITGVSLARYQSLHTVDVGFTTPESGSFTVTTGNWEPTYDEYDPEKQTGYELEFKIRNSGAEALDVSVYLLASIGLEYGDNITVYFWTWENGAWQKHEADWQRITEGSLLARSFGDGWEYRSYVRDPESGEWVERSWAAEPGETVTGWVTIEQWEGFTITDHPVQLRLGAYAQDP